MNFVLPSATMVDAVGWTRPLVDDGWMGEKQKFPTARQIVCWVACPECGAEKGIYCAVGRVQKRTGELMDLEDWLEENGVGKPAPSCEWRRRNGRKEFKKRVDHEKRRQAQLAKAMAKYRPERLERRARRLARERGQGDLFDAPGLFDSSQDDPTA